MIIQKESKDFCFKYLFFTAKQKNNLLFAQDIQSGDTYNPDAYKQKPQ
jgi:hypothetical protein